MDINEYQKYRKAGMENISLVFNLVTKEDFEHSAALLNMISNGAIISDNDTDQTALMDLIVFEKHKKPQTIIEEFYETADELPDLQEDILEGMIDNHLSVFEVKDIDRNSAVITLTDLLDKGKREYRLIDISASKTSMPGHILITRLIPIKDLFMTSGNIFSFKKEHKNKILDNISFQKLKHRRNLTTKEIFIMGYFMHNDFGITTFMEEV